MAQTDEAVCVPSESLTLADPCPDLSPMLGRARSRPR